MRTLSASELLDVWERGLEQGPVWRALTLLAVACPGTSPDDLARLSVGRRDADLLTLREMTFGSQIASLAACPQCGEQLEFSVRADDLRTGASSDPEPLATSIADGYELQFRLPNSFDLAALGEQPDATGARRLLLERCLLAAQRGDEPVNIDRLPEHVIDAIEESMERADPQADLHLALRCPACDHRWRSVFDIVAFFWSEIDAWAVRILSEVHILALAYGWRERDILALSHRRRQFYLEMVGG